MDVVVDKFSCSASGVSNTLLGGDKSLIAMIRGKLALKEPAGTIIVDTGAVGYRLFVSLNSLMDLPEVGEEISLHVVTVVREDSFTLFGFTQTGEKDLFNLLVQVKGIGPKVAIALLGGLKPSDLKTAIAREDAAWISTVPGVGKKTAERIVLELKDKVGTVPDAGESAITDVDEQLLSDVLSALANLGYHSSLGRRTVKSVLERENGPEDFQGIIRECLKELSGRKA